MNFINRIINPYILDYIDKNKNYLFGFSSVDSSMFGQHSSISIPKVSDILKDIGEIQKQIINIIRKTLSIFVNDSDKQLQYGDIIGIARTSICGLIPYDHYGVYVNNNEVIHFSSKQSDVSMSDNQIISTDYDAFKRDDNSVFKLHFPKSYDIPGKIIIDEKSFSSAFSANLARDFLKYYFKKMKKYHLYTPEETVQRAKSKISSKNYSILTNNCEHFAIWCKTGIHESHQINKLLELIDILKSNI